MTSRKHTIFRYTKWETIPFAKRHLGWFGCLLEYSLNLRSRGRPIDFRFERSLLTDKPENRVYQNLDSQVLVYHCLSKCFGLRPSCHWDFCEEGSQSLWWAHNSILDIGICHDLSHVLWHCLIVFGACTQPSCCIRWFIPGLILIQSEHSVTCSKPMLRAHSCCIIQAY